MDLGSVAPAAGAEWIGTVPHEELVRGIRPQLPSEDPFYEPPTGYQHSTPGTVLRSRDVELAFLGSDPAEVTATQLLYRTTDMHGNADAAATTVIVPAERAPEAVTPVSPTSARSTPSPRAASRRMRCGGTRTPRVRSHRSSSSWSRRALAEGWAVSVPDHEGRLGMWGAPYEPGYHVLDGLRAALSSRRLDLSPDAPIGLWGYSGGGLASAWAAEMSGSYAPELNVVGAVLGSPVGDLGHTFRRLNGTLMSGLPALVVAALVDIYPDLDRIIDEHATDEGKELLKRLHNDDHRRGGRADGQEGHGRHARPAAGADPRHPGGAARLRRHQARQWRCRPRPVLIVQAVHDQLISVETTSTSWPTRTSRVAHR